MADASAALCFSAPFRLLPNFFPRSPSYSHSNCIEPTSSSRASNLSFPSPFSSSARCPSRGRLVARSHGKDSNEGGRFGGDPYGPYPWEPSIPSDGDQTIKWLQEERITLFTTEGLYQIGGSLVPRSFPPSDKRQGRSKASQRFQRFQESDYMDPDQGLCIGALFDIAATNGLDTGRRLCIFGFCRSIEMLNDVVEDTVLEYGGEVVAAEKASKGGLQEKLKMIVAVPFLWGVPPASDTLRLAVRSGGGIVEKIYWQWDFL